MYEVWFMSCLGYWIFDVAFDSLEEAEHYIEEFDDEAKMEIRERWE